MKKTSLKNSLGGSYQQTSSGREMEVTLEEHISVALTNVEYDDKRARSWSGDKNGGKKRRQRGNTLNSSTVNRENTHPPQ